MTTPSEGAAELQRLINEACARVDAAFGIVGRVSIDFDTAGFPPGTTARSDDRGVHLDVIELAKKGPGYVQYIVYEEVAHYVATQRGLPGSRDALSTLLQELVAGYVQHLLLRQHHADMLANIEFKPPPSDPTDPLIPYNVGKHLGVELLGEATSTQMLDEWASSASAHPMWQEGIPIFREAFAPAKTPDDVCAIAIDLYRAMRQA